MSYAKSIESYRELSLPNGMRAVIAVDRRIPQVALNVRYQVGDALDPPDQRGIARVVGKALPWLATRHLKAGERERLYHAAGLKFERPTVQVNGFATNSSVQVPAEALELALWVEADRMGFAADGVTKRVLTWSIDEARKELWRDADDQDPSRSFFTAWGGEQLSLSEQERSQPRALEREAD
jgi:predicted Zn-dependent peptidase